MKQYLLAICFWGANGLAFANPVNIQTATTVAANFMGQKGITKTVSRQLLSGHVKNDNNRPSYYVFNVANNGGFVIVAADDAVKPILAYSTENAFPSNVANNEVAYWLDDYQQQINYVVSHQILATSKIAAEWTSLLHYNAGHTAAKPTNVPPLIATQWDQWNSFASGPTNDLYNNLCPALTPTGCVATAMAQIMKYWNSPTMGTGSHTYNSFFTGGPLSANFGATNYDWANMPITLTDTSTTIQKNAIAVLMFHCGVSVNMIYNTAQNGGSGAFVVSSTTTSPCAQNALPAYFNYKTTIKGCKRIDYSDTVWLKLLKFEINNGRPILYTGYGTGGHAFDFDGYDDQDNFHVNWGWSGIANGYYTVDHLNPVSLGTGGGSGNYNNNQAALIMIEPANSTLPPNPITPDYPPIVDNGLALADSITQSNDTIVFNTAYSIAAKIQNRSTTDTFNSGFLGIAAIDYNNTSNYVILNVAQNVSIIPGGTYTYNFNTAGMPNLPVGKYQIAFYFSKTMGSIPGLVSDSLWFNGKNLTVIPKSTPPTAINNTALNAAKIIISPNPARDVISIDWKALDTNVLAIDLFNVSGQKVKSIGKPCGSQLKVSINGLSKGIYNLKINTEKGFIPKKIVIQ